MIPAEARCRLPFYAALAPHSPASPSLPAQARRLPGVGTQLRLLPRCSEVCRVTFIEPDRDWDSKPLCTEDGPESCRRQGLAVPPPLAQLQASRGSIRLPHFPRRFIFVSFAAAFLGCVLQMGRLWPESIHGHFFDPQDYCFTFSFELVTNS